jgi:hypothetical protein
VLVFATTSEQRDVKGVPVVHLGGRNLSLSIEVDDGLSGSLLLGRGDFKYVVSDCARRP